MLTLFCYIDIEFSDCQTFIQFLKIYQNVTISIPLTSRHHVFTVNKKKVYLHLTGSNSASAFLRHVHSPSLFSTKLLFYLPFKVVFTSLSDQVPLVYNSPIGKCPKTMYSR